MIATGASVEQQKKTIVFLRMAVIELRRLAETSPEIAESLRHLAQQLEDEANDLAAATDC